MGYAIGFKERCLAIVFVCHMLAAPQTGGQNIPDVQRILRDHVSACGPTNLCNPTILRSHNYTYVDSTYCSPCPPCFCDEWCYFLADCCLDIQLNMTKRFSNTTKYSDRGIVCTPEIRFDQTRMHKDPRSSEEYLVIMECPDNFTDMELKDKCENPSANDSMLLVPVSSAKNGLAYRNIGCFDCHGAEHPVTWDLKIRRCKKPLLQQKLTTASVVIEEALQSSCTMSYVPNLDLLYQRTCVRKNLLHTCRETDTDPDIDWACENLYTNVDTRNQYANLFCLRCNLDAQPKTKDSCNITGLWKIFDNNLNEGCINGIVEHMPQPLQNYKNVYCFLCNIADNVGGYCSDSPMKPQSSLGMMFDMSSILGSIGIGDENGQKCGRREVYDQFKGKCRPTFCPLCKFAKDEICMPLRKDGTVQNAYSLFFRLRPVDTVSSELICQLMHGVQTAIMGKLEKEMQVKGTNQILAFLTFNASSHLDRNESGDVFSNMSGNLKNGDSSNDIMVSIDLMIRTALVNITKCEENLLSAREFSYSIAYGQNETYKFQAYIDDMPYSIFKAESGQIAECSMQTNTDQYTMKNKHFSIVGETLKCKQIELEEDEYSVNVNDFSIFVPAILETLSISQYVFLGRRARVCLEDYFQGSVKSKPKLPNNSGYQHYVRAFVKLFTLTGITWILQLVDASLEYSEIGYSVLSLTVTVMNSSHGAFIFFAFVCNSRIYHSYRELFSRCKAFFTEETNVNDHVNGVEGQETRF
ncbi:hypothetical protein ScPMuIL_010933 [Solemya velum]